MHLHDATDTLVLAASDVLHISSRIQPAAVTTEEGEPADEWIRHDLEGQGCKWFLCIGFAGDLFTGLRINADDRFHIEWTRKVSYHTIKHGLHPFILERRSAEHRHDRHVDGRLANGLMYLILGDGVGILKKLLHEGIVIFCDGLNELASPVFHIFFHVCRYVDHFIGHAMGSFMPDDPFQRDQIDNPFEIVLTANGKLQWNGFRPKHLAHLLHHIEEVSTGTVHFVHEPDAGNPIAVGLAPDRFRLGFYPVHCRKQCHEPVEYAHGTLHLNSEIHVSGGIDDVELILFRIRGGFTLCGRVIPETSYRCRCDGDSAFLLLLHPVCGGSAVMHLTDLVRHTRVIKDTLGSGRFAGIDVGSNPEIPLKS